MNLGDLRKCLADLAHLPDNTPVVVPGSDHSYLRADDVLEVTAAVCGRTLCESDPDDDTEKRVTVVLVY